MKQIGNDTTRGVSRPRVFVGLVRSISLTVAHRFSELLGGELRAISTPGQHAAFTMRLPIRGTSTQS